MNDPQRTVPGDRPPTGGDGRRLDRAPGERYRGGTGAGGGTAGGGGTRGRGDPATPGGSTATRSGPGRPVIAAVVVADLGALLFFGLGLLDLGVGLLAVAAFTGWATALALAWWGRAAIPAASTRMAIGAFLGGWSVAGGILVDWVASLLQHGALGPLDYIDQRYGLVAPLSIVVAAGIAALRAR